MTLELQATPAEVMRAVEALEELAVAKGVSKQTAFGLALALEECGSNVVHHALQGDAQQKFEIEIEHLGDSIVIELRDHGPEFDPTAAAERATEEDDDIPGGWGIQLVRRYADEIRYRRHDGQNILRIAKRLP